MECRPGLVPGGLEKIAVELKILVEIPRDAEDVDDVSTWRTETRG